MTTPSVDNEAQKAWDDAVRIELESVAKEIDSLDPEDDGARAEVYRDLRALKDKVAQCGPELRKYFNKAIDTLYGHMDAIPNNMYLNEEDPKF